MARCRSWRRLVAGPAALVAVVGLTVGGCSGDPDEGADPPARSRTAATGEVWDLVVISDSSGWRLAHAWARLVRRDQNVRVRVTDIAVGMYTGVRILDDLRTEGSEVREAVEDAEVISVWLSPLSLDWDVSSQCAFQPDSTRPPPRPTREDFRPYARLWRDTLAEIDALRDTRATAVRTRDVYDPTVARLKAAGTAEECGRIMDLITATVRDETRRPELSSCPCTRPSTGRRGPGTCRPGAS